MEGTCLEAAETVQSYQPTHQPINHIVSSPNTRQTLLPLQICGHTVTRVNPHVIARVAAAVGEVTTLKPWNIALLLCRPTVFWRVVLSAWRHEDGRWWNAVALLWAHPTDRVMARTRRRHDMRLPRGKVYLISSHHKQWESLSLYWRRTVTLVPSHRVRLDFIASNLTFPGCHQYP